MHRVMILQVEAGKTSQYEANIGRLKDMAAVTFDGIKALKSISDRAGEIATLAGGVRSSTELRAYATESEQLIEQALRIANTKYQGQFLFGGTKSDQSPFVATRDASNAVTGVAYAGNESLAETEIEEGYSITAQVVGASSSGSGPQGLIADSRTGADLFAHLISLRQHLTAGDTSAIQGDDAARLAKDEESLVAHLGRNGAIQARLEAAAATGGNRALSIEKLVSNEADADLAQTIVRLNETQNAYRAALQSGSFILNNSLLDYLR
jgi:flagellar hook-associated protein 3 FlgL